MVPRRPGPIGPPSEPPGRRSRGRRTRRPSPIRRPERARAQGGALPGRGEGKGGAGGGSGGTADQPPEHKKSKGAYGPLLFLGAGGTISAMGAEEGEAPPGDGRAPPEGPGPLGPGVRIEGRGGPARAQHDTHAPLAAEAAKPRPPARAGRPRTKASIPLMSGGLAGHRRRAGPQRAERPARTLQVSAPRSPARVVRPRGAGLRGKRGVLSPPSETGAYPFEVALPLQPL